MPATTNSDKFLNTVPRWSGQVGAAGVSSTTATVIPLQSTTGLVNDRAYFFTFNRLTGTTKNPVSSTEGLVGVINTATNEITTTPANRGLEGAANAWAAGTLVEILHSAGYMNRFIEGLEVSLNQDGTLKSTALDGTKVYAADAGSTDDYAITLAPAPNAYAAGQTFRFKANTANTGPATLNVNGLGAKTIKKNYNSDLTTGDILANQLVEVIYDGTSFQLLSPSSALSENNGMARQSLINGNFDVFQLVNFAAKTASGYCLDEWYAAVGGMVTITQQSTGAPAGSSNVVRVAYNAASSFANLCQALEMVDAKKFWGKKVTAGVKLRRNSTFAANIVLKIQKNSTGDVMTSGTWSDIGLTTILNSNLPTGSSSTDWVIATVTVTVPSDGSANGLRVVIGESAAGGNGEYYEASQAQLCMGDVVLPFQPKSFNDELLACMRKYEKSYDYGVALGTNTPQGGIYFNATGSTYTGTTVYYKVPKRALVTPTIYSRATGATSKIRNTNTSTDLNGQAANVGEKSFFVQLSGVAASAGDELSVHFSVDARLP